jgi:hypothetical protein
VKKPCTHASEVLIAQSLHFLLALVLRLLLLLLLILSSSFLQILFADGSCVADLSHDVQTSKIENNIHKRKTLGE